MRHLQHTDEPPDKEIGEADPEREAPEKDPKEPQDDYVGPGSDDNPPPPPPPPHGQH